MDRRCLPSSAGRPERIDNELCHGCFSTGGRAVAILIADTKESLLKLQNLLGSFDLVCVRSMREAQKALSLGRIDACVVGVHFDDSRWIELMQSIRKDPKLADIPILVVRMEPSDIAHSFRSTLKAMSRAIGFVEYIEIEGNAKGPEELRVAVKRCIEQT